jgi:hypothetical protein
MMWTNGMAGRRKGNAQRKPVPVYKEGPLISNIMYK